MSSSVAGNGGNQVTWGTQSRSHFRSLSDNDTVTPEIYIVSKKMTLSSVTLVCL